MQNQSDGASGTWTLANILVVDDEPVVRKRLVQTLERAGHLAREADSGSSALEITNAGGIDVVMLDVGLPDMDGMEVCTEIKKRFPCLPVVFITGAAEDRAFLKRCKEAGADDFLFKPLDLFSLMVRVERLIQSKRAFDALEENNIALTVKNAELERLNQFKAEALRLLGDPETGLVPNLLRQTELLTNNIGNLEKAKRHLGELTRSAQQIGRLFKYNDFYDAAEAALQGKQVLVVEEQRNQRRLTHRAVIATGANVDSVATVEEGKAILEQKQVDTLIVDWESTELVKHALKEHPGIHMVLHTNESLFEGKGSAMLKLPISSVMITNVQASTSSHDPMAVRELVTTAGKLITGDIFGLEKYLGWGTAIHQATITGSEQRHQVLDQLRDYAGTYGLRGRLTTNLVTLADELMMNAIWDAPVDEKGKPKYATTPRGQAIILEPHEQATVRYGTDGNFLGFSVSDPFGRLEHETAHNYLVRCFARNEDQMNKGPGGAGLGLYMAYRSVSSFVINVEPQKATEVNGLINLHRGAESAGHFSRSFCYFRTP